MPAIRLTDEAMEMVKAIIGEETCDNWRM
jgi:hypothetical protein